MKIIFLDRDGVINKYPGDTRYVASWQEFCFLPNTKAAVRKLTESQYKIFIISNQAGVAKGIYSKEVLDEITSKMLKELDDSGGKGCGVYYCIHRDEDNCSCRKPKAGLLEKAVKEYNIPKDILNNSFFVGDSIRDIQTGKSAGCRTILVFSGKEKPPFDSTQGGSASVSEAKPGNQAGWSVQPDCTATDLLEAVGLIL